MTDGGTTKDALLRSLGRQRSHVLDAVEGLSDAQLREPVLPSGWSLLGLVNHLALDVERYWFVQILGGAPLVDDAGDDGDDDRTGSWRVGDDVAASTILDRYRAEIAAADPVLAGIDLDAEPAQRDPWWGEWQVPDARFVLLHVITETATHAGHADAVRELLDGHQYLTL